MITYQFLSELCDSGLTPDNVRSIPLAADLAGSPFEEEIREAEQALRQPYDLQESDREFVNEYCDTDGYQHYKHGWCHKYALILACAMNRPVSVWWDLAAWDEGMDVIPKPCLVHAFVLSSENLVLDVAGNTTTIEDFEVNELEYASYPVSDFIKILKKEGWNWLGHVEVDALNDLIERTHGVKVKESLLSLLKTNNCPDLEAALSL
jgi:hypothetical protein